MAKPPTKVCTLLFLRRGDEILLAMKKRGFGAGHWNGVGGKIEPDETIEAALVRETEEEIGVTPKVYEKVARQHFMFNEALADIVVHTFIATDWTGEPIESDEMAPQWFNVNDIPYAQMWDDDIYWLPAVLSGKKLHGHFRFADDHTTVEAVAIKVVTDLE